jgi:hypothetical protein
MSFSFYYPDSPYYLPTTVAVDISAIIINQPINTVYTITPALPSPLVINNTTGSITGTPNFSSIIPATTYTVDASYSTGIVSSTINLSINFRPQFVYPQTPYVIAINTLTTIIPVYLINNSQTMIYTVIGLPLLSDISLNLNAQNGVISGTPLLTSSAQIYTIRANNSGVTYDASLSISVEQPPTISYPQSSYNLTQGQFVSIMPIVTTIQTGVIYGINDLSQCALPLGLSFNTATGEISGTPTLLTTSRKYTIYIINAIGSASTTLILNVAKVFLAPPVTGDGFTSSACLTYPVVAMRRKAEIFKYKSNNANMSSNRLFSLAAQGKGPYARRAWGNQNDLGSNPNISGLPQQGNTIICNSPAILCAPTSSSDVPGPIMDLCYDSTAPLIGYIQPNRTKVNIGFKWPQRGWAMGDMGFPVGSAGNNNM